jgi:hypothetical protein
MPHPSLIAPNTGNLRIGKGALYFKREGASDYAHLGNAPSITQTPTISKLDHFSSLNGTKEKDLSVVIERGGAMKILLDEWTPANISLALLGVVDEGAVGGPTVEMFSTDAVSGALKFISSNDIGPRWNAFWFNVSFIPANALNLISDAFGQIEVDCEILVSQTAPNVGRFGYWQLTNLES